MQPESVDESRRLWCNRIKGLEDTRDLWVHRVVATLDFSDGFGTYVERITYDLDVSKLGLCISNGERYIPLVWRKRETFLEFDCESNSGESFQLVPLIDRQRYCQWLFWQKCQELGKGDGSKFPKCIHDSFWRHIEEGAYPSAKFFDCPQNAQKMWDDLVADPVVRRIYDELGAYQPLILRIRQGADVSIVKLRERKTLAKPKTRSIKDVLDGTFIGSVEAPSASCTKIIPPRDTRIRDARPILPIVETRGFDLNIESETQIHGDGSWAFSPTKTYSTTVIWILEFTSRRSYFVSPGFRTSLLSLVASLYWLVSMSGRGSVSSAANTFSMAVVASYFVYHLNLFGQHSGRSLQFQWALRWQRYALMAVIGMTICFPFVDHIYCRASEFVSHASKWLPFLAKPIDFSVRTLLSSNFRLFTKWTILVSLLVVLCNFVHVSKIGRPQTKNRS